MITDKRKALQDGDVNQDNPDVTKKCKPFLNSKEFNNYFKELTFTALESATVFNSECRIELIKKLKDDTMKLKEYKVAARDKYNELRVAYLNEVKTLTTTDDRYAYGDNIYDILIRSNDNLVAALTGKFPKDNANFPAKDNILTGIKVKVCTNVNDLLNYYMLQESTDAIKTTLKDSTNTLKNALDAMKFSLQTAINGFTKKLQLKFTTIKTWGAALTCPPPVGKCPPLFLVRNLVYQNGTDEEYNQALDWFNATLINSELTDQEKVIKDYIMTDPDILSGILKPIAESITQDVTESNNTSEEDGINNESVGAETEETSNNINGIFEDENQNEVHIFDVGLDGKLGILHFLK